MKLFLSIIGALSFTILAKAQVYETQVEQASGADGAYAQFKLWIPPGSHPNRLIALTWGGNQCSLDAVTDPGWQDLAKSIDAGLLSCFFVPQTSNNPWDEADAGSGQALLDALPALARMSDNSQLSNAQLYLVGDSQGGQFSFSFTGWHPDRVLGFVSVKGGRHDPCSIEKAAKIPGLFFAGEYDVPYRVANIEQTFWQGRLKNAPWCLAIDKGRGHESSPCAPLLLAFLKELYCCDKGAFPTFSEPPRRSDFNASAYSWFPTTKFKNEWILFESGKLTANGLSPSFDSSIPPNTGSSLPPACDLGAINAGDKASLTTLRIIPGTPALWNKIKVLERPYLSELVAANPDSGLPYISFKLDSEALPLGRFTGAIPVRFAQQDRPILGGINIPVTATITGDVASDPSFIELERTHSNGPTSVKIEIHSKSNENIRLVSFKTPQGVSLKFDSMLENPFKIVVLFNRADKNVALDEKGVIWLTVETSQKWTLRIPYFTSIVSPAPQN